MILEQNLFYEESFEGHYLFLLFEHQTTIWSYPFGNFHLLTILSQLNSVAQSCSNLWIRTAAPQASLSITNSWSLLKLMSIESVIPSTHLFLCCPLLLLPSIFPSIRVFPVSQFLTSGGQSIGASASASFRPMNIQDWFPLALTGLIPLQSKKLSRVFSNTTVQKHQFFGIQLSL